MGELTSAVVEPDKGGTLITSAYDGDDAEPWFLKGSAVQSSASDSLWRFTWNHTGEVVGFTLAPNGNADATADEPILRGSLTVGPRPALGGAASDKTFVFDFDWQLTGPPLLDDGSDS
ncbi:hypothetical protein GCM10009840_17850 [Pseudolysinimonas kribbensis]|uniref:Uncharacterized protein n=2 Tax=Pseudolysinimonas kribbensis TaxID=433641 RepID=A0ABQ6K018_9MICO|nr:hypothetical protein GCM10025881_06570 [Pseudolysinimonas kribbensis]